MSLIIFSMFSKKGESKCAHRAQWCIIMPHMGVSSLKCGCFLLTYSKEFPQGGLDLTFYLCILKISLNFCKDVSFFLGASRNRFFLKIVRKRGMLLHCGWDDNSCSLVLMFVLLTPITTIFSVWWLLVWSSTGFTGACFFEFMTEDGSSFLFY